AGGAMLMTSGANDNEGGQIILGSAAGGGGFFPAANNHIWFEARIYAGVVRAAEFNYFVGLVDPTAAEIVPDDGGAFTFNNILGFTAQDTDVNWSSVGRRVAVEDLNPLGAGAVVTAAWHTIKGSGGGMTENGALTDCATSPSAFPVVFTALSWAIAVQQIIQIKKK
ncbi:hypothetical protein LCGC14_2552170, partial [marine sediment metagenome]